MYGKLLKMVWKIKNMLRTVNLLAVLKKCSKKHITSHINIIEVIIIKAFYIKESDKPNIITKVFNTVNVYDYKIIIEPNLKDKKIIKIVKKIIKICRKRNIKNVVLSKNLQKNEVFVNQIKSSGIIIFDGKWLFNYLVYETVDFILEKIVGYNKR